MAMLSLLPLIALLAAAAGEGHAAKPGAQELQTFVEYQVVDGSGVDRTYMGSRKVWRVGARLARVESTNRTGPQVLVINAPGVFSGNAAEKRWFRHEETDAAFLPATFTKSARDAAGGLEIGNEIEYFKSAGSVRGKDEDVQNTHCAVFELRKRKTILKLYIDLAARRPLRLTVESPEGAYAIQYSTYERKQAPDPSLYEVPQELSAGGRSGLFDDEDFDPSYSFAVSGDKGEVNDLSCRRMPVILYRFVPDTESETHVMDLFRKYQRGKSCFFAIAAGNPTRSAGMPLFKLVHARQLGSGDAPKAVLIGRSGSPRHTISADTDSGRAEIGSILEEIVNDGSSDADVYGHPEKKFSSADEELEHGERSRLLIGMLDRHEYTGLEGVFADNRTKKARETHGAWRLEADYRGMLGGAANAVATEQALPAYERWARESAQSATARVALARLWLQHARFAGDAGERGARLTKAPAVLQEARALKEKCPALYSTLIDVSRELKRPRQEVDAVYAEGKAVEPAYQYLYVSMIRYLRSDGRGKPGEWERLLAQVEKENPDGRGADLYFRVVNMIKGDAGLGRQGDKLFKNSTLSWAAVKRGIEAAELWHPDSVFNRNVFAYLAGVAGDKPTAERQFQSIGRRYSAVVWGNEVNFEHVKRWSRGGFTAESGDHSARLLSMLGAEGVRPLSVSREAQRRKLAARVRRQTAAKVQAPAPRVRLSTGTAAGTPVYVEYEHVLGSGAKETRLRKLWRMGDDKVRLEEPASSPTAAHTFYIINGEDIYAGDLTTGRGNIIKNANPQNGKLVPAFPSGVPGDLTGLELGREIEFFEDHDADRTEDEDLDGVPCVVLKLRWGGTEAILFVDRATSLPHRLKLKDHSLTYWVRYAKYERMTRIDSSLFNPPPGMELKAVDATATSDDTPFEDERDEVRKFVLVNPKTGYWRSEKECWHRPGLLYFFDLNGERSVEQARLLHSKYKNTALCLFMIPIGGLDSDPTTEEGRESIRESHSYDFPGFIPLRNSALRAIRKPKAILIQRDGSDSEVPELDGIPDPRRLAAGLSKLLDPEHPDSDIASDDPEAQHARSEKAVFDNEAGVARIRRLLEDRKFEELDRHFAGRRAKKTRNSAGIWYLRSEYPLLSEHDGTEASIRARMVLLEEWKLFRPQSITPRVALGSLWIDYAWRARGGDYSHRLSDDQTRNFRERLRRARDVFSAARKLEEKCPELYLKMILLAKGEGWPREEALEIFNEGRNLEPSYQYLYEQMSWLMSEKWGGEPGEWEKFLEVVVRQNVGGVGAEMYARVASLHMFGGSSDFGRYGTGLFKRTRMSWDLVKRGEHDMAARYPTSKYNMNTFARLACMAGDRETARDMMELIGKDYSPNVWGNRINYERARRWANRSPSTAAGLRKKI